MEIDSKDKFLKLMFEKNFSSVDFESDGESDLTYMLNPQKDVNGEWLTSQFAQWWGKSENYYFAFTRTGTTTSTYTGVVTDAGVIANTYDRIYNKVKRKDKFYKMYSFQNDNYACYECDKAKFDGYLCFTIRNGNGTIAQLKYID